MSAISLLEPDPLPLPDVGRPPLHRLCPEGTPPIGLEVLGARATTGGYLVPCPCCVQGWCLLVPDGQPYGYGISLDAWRAHPIRHPRTPHQLVPTQGPNRAAPAWVSTTRGRQIVTTPGAARIAASRLASCPCSR